MQTNINGIFGFDIFCLKNKNKCILGKPWKQGTKKCEKIQVSALQKTRVRFERTLS